MRKKSKDIKKIVRKGYGKIAVGEGSCCSSGSCCSGPVQMRDISRIIGYSDNEIDNVVEGANLGLGCGNPVALAALKKGDVVLDLGSGAGFDAFLASKRVGRTGRVIGVDMTPEMVAKARANAKKGGYTNVEFRKGEIEKLAFDDNSIDIIISNCVINLSPDKRAVFKEAFRVLKPGGRLIVSDLMLEKELPDAVRNSDEAYIGCLSGAVKKEDYLNLIEEAGFKRIRILGRNNYPLDILTQEPEIKGVRDSVVSLKIHAVKPLK